jgi:hypothetical protein
VLLIACAVVFLALLFFIKNRSWFSSTANYLTQSQNPEGLTYDTDIVENLVAKDTDSDGVVDWEESLWGTDPSKKDTDGDGVPDNVAIEKLKKEREDSVGVSESPGEAENLTKTDEFSRELFATIAALNQNGEMDQATMDQLGASLADRIQNATPRKIFTLSDLKIIKSDTVADIKNYNDALDKINKINTGGQTVIDILQKFTADGNNVDTSALAELDPIIEQAQEIVEGMKKISVPQSLASLHLNFLNALERISENVSDIKLYDTDSVVALGAISQYNDNTTALGSATNALGNAIEQKLKY